MENIKKYAAVTTITGAGLSVSLEYLDIFNSVAGSVAVIVTIVGGYWLYRKNKAEALKILAETEKIQLENEYMKIKNNEEHYRIKSKKIEQQIEQSIFALINKIEKHLEK